MKYTKEYCYEFAKQCKTRSEIKRKNPNVYSHILHHEYDSDYYWLSPRRTTPGYWQNKENCIKESKKYKTKREFQQNSSGAYDSACRNGWLKEFNWLVSDRKPIGYWTYDSCYKKALEYEFLSDFRENNQGAYDKAITNGWLYDYVWLKRKDIDLVNGKIDCVYAYEFTSNHSVYVGRTLYQRLERRNYEHCNRVNDTVFEYSIKSGETIPHIKVLQKDLTLEDGVKYEGVWVNRYEELGWNIINKAKTGSIGTLLKWSKNKCYQEAKKYKTRTDFRNGSLNAYNAAKQKGWLSEFDWLEHGTEFGYWQNKDNCANESRKYKSRGEFYEKSNGAYTSALKHGWLDDFDWLVPLKKPAGYWDSYLNCKTESLKYRNRSSFKKKCYAAFKHSKENGWLDEFFPKQTLNHVKKLCKGLVV